MKLVIVIVQNRYREALMDGLKKADYRLTELSSSGGFLRKRSTTFLVGINEEDADKLQKTMQRICLRYEEAHGRNRDQDHRYVSFMVDTEDAVPFFSRGAGTNN
ncbi:MAG: transcriptional regulator [Alkalicoccus sp.]|nr:MAG: transcriptional regulator [Alkalicoccus sp.]